MRFLSGYSVDSANGQSVRHRAHNEAGDCPALLFRGKPNLVCFFWGAVNE